MTLSEYEMYMTSLNEMENRIIDDTKFPVVRDNKIKTCCYATLELLDRYKLSQSKYTRCLQKENITKQFRRKTS